MEFDAARDEFLGDRRLRTRTRPTKPTNVRGNRTGGEATGGIAYERTKVCKPVQEDTRCYTLGPSGEAPTSIVAPVASAKMPTEQIEPDAALRQRVLAVSRPDFMDCPVIVIVLMTLCPGRRRSSNCCFYRGSTDCPHANA
jgi:hypothetical protein